MVKKLVAALAALSACSFGVKSVDPKWDGTEEPECSDSWAPVIGDGLMAGVGLGVASAGADAESDIAVLGGVAVGLVFAISGIVGESAIGDCKAAKAQWRVGGAIGRASRANAVPEEDDDAVARRQARERRATEQKRREEERAPRGFYCATSATVDAAGLCAREKSDCVRARGSVVAAVPDLSECALAEGAWCYDSGGASWCAPTSAACDAQRDKVPDAGPCAEVR